MKKLNYFLLIFFCFIFINLFVVQDLKSIIINSCNLWIYNLVPSIFPFYIISDLLINYNFINILKFILEKPLKYFFKISDSAIFVIIFSILTGFPSSAKYISNLLKEDLISIEESNKIIKFTHFSNPLFIVNVIGSSILGNKLLGYFILISHITSNLIIAFIFRNEPIIQIINNHHHQENFSQTLSKSIMNTFNALLIILGNLIVFQLITNILFHYFTLSSNIKVLANLLVEITSGLFSIKSLNINLYLKIIIITAALSFGGLCVHSQTYGILSETKVKYKNYLVGRILQAIISSILISLILFCYRI